MCPKIEVGSALWREGLIFCRAEKRERLPPNVSARLRMLNSELRSA